MKTRDFLLNSALLAMVCAVSACSPDSALPPEKPVNPGDKNKGSKGDDNLGVASVPKDAAKASLTFKNLSQVPASHNSTGRVPGLSVTFGTADYYKLLRCQDGTPVSTSLGIDAKKSLSTLKTSELSDVWNRLTNESKCVFVGTKIGRETFQDLTAGHTMVEQKFFYVLNPCVNHSTTNEACSYKLAITDSITYTSPFAAEFIQVGQILNELEGQLTSSFSQLHAIATATRVEIEKCEDAHFEKKLDEKKKKGLFDILSVGVSSVVGTLIAGPIGGLGTVTGILNGVMGFFQPKADDTPFSCEAAEKHKPLAMQLVQSDIPELIQQVKTVRTKLNKLNSAYGKLDIQNVDDNN